VVEAYDIIIQTSTKDSTFFLKYFPAAAAAGGASLVWSGKHKKGLTFILPFWQAGPQIWSTFKKKGRQVSPSGEA